MGKNQSKPEQDNNEDNNQNSKMDEHKKSPFDKQNSSPLRGQSYNDLTKEEIKLDDSYLSSQNRQLKPNSETSLSKGNSVNKGNENGDTSVVNGGYTIDDMKAHPVYQEHGEKAFQIHTFLENIFQCTFHKISWEKRPGLRLLQNEENKKEEILLFTLDNFEDTIQKVLESSTYFQSDEKLFFLHNIYTRLCNNNGNAIISTEKKNEMKETSMSYIVSYLMSPEVFSADVSHEEAKNLQDYSCMLYDMFYVQLANSGRDGFIKDLVLNLSEEDYEVVIVPILKRILRDCVESSVENIKKVTKAMELLEIVLEADKKVVNFFVNHDLFLPKTDAPNINGVYLQKMTIFGACLTLTTFPNESKIAHTHFSERNSLKNSEEIVSMLRTRIHTVIDFVYRIMEYIMKCDQKYKRNILDWLYIGLSLNDARQKTFNFGSMVSTDGWFSNFLLLLIKFSQKMLEDVSKYPNWFEKIDFQFLKQKQIFNNIVLINGQTNVYFPSEKKELDMSSEPQDTKTQQDKYTFLSELVFMINHAIFLQNSTNKTFIELLQKMQKHHAHSGPNSRTFLSLYAKKLAYDVQAADPYLLNHIYKLLVFDILLMMYTLNVPLTKLEEPSKLFESIPPFKSEEQSAQKVSLPIYWTENIQECLLFLRQISPSTLNRSPKNFEIAMDYILMAIGNDSWISNPHVKAKYLQILNSLVPQKEPSASSKEEDFSPLFEKNLYYKNRLIKNIFEYFLDVERTCSSGQFYEKYSYRYGCCAIIRYLLKKLFSNDKNSYITKSLNDLSKESHDTYLQFWTICLNDMISLLDESIDKLADMKAFQQEISENQILLILSFHDRHERAILQEQNKKLVQTFLNYLNTYYGMLTAVVGVSPDFFLKEDIKEKFVVSLNYSVQQLLGRNPKKLKLKSMRELRFDPKVILENVVQIYLQFQKNEDFLQTVVNDERSFDVEILQKLLKVLKKYMIINDTDMERFSSLTIELTKRAKEKEEEDKFIAGMSDIPEEFIDPIMNHIMKDPVLLPTSNIIVDRVTITKHLNSGDNTDPFNRTKLTKDMVLHQPELKKRIEEFFKNKKNSLKGGN